MKNLGDGYVCQLASHLHDGFDDPLTNGLGPSLGTLTFFSFGHFVNQPCYNELNVYIFCGYGLQACD
jgi:hypothetical protein